MHIIAGKAVCFREAMSDAFRVYAQTIIDNAQALAEVLQVGGLTLISGGTDNHLLLADVTPLQVTGKTAEAILEQCGITVNKNMIPFDERKPLDPSGIRIGTPALTTRGMGRDEMRSIGQWMLRALRAPADAVLHAQIRGEVRDMCAQFPVPAASLGADRAAVPG
jgi:glycine hydroxymethyltransferase